MVLDDDDSQTGQGQVQTHVMEIWEGGGSWRPLPDFKQVRQNVSKRSEPIRWKKVTIWFGTSRVPYHREPSEPPLGVKSECFD